MKNGGILLLRWNLKKIYDWRYLTLNEYNEVESKRFGMRKKG